MRDNENGLKVALYMRVATGEQTEDARMAMSRQETLLEKLTEDCENIVVGRFWDYASGIRYDRPGLCAAIESVSCGRADALLVKDYARLGRDPLLTEELIRKLRSDGKQVFNLIIISQLVKPEMNEA